MLKEVCLNMMKTWDTQRERETKYHEKEPLLLVTPETTWQGAIES